MPVLTKLPPEIIAHVLAFVDAEDLLYVPLVCKSLHHAVTNNVSLYKNHYLKLLDAPPKGSRVEWEKTVKDVLRMQAICRKPDVDAKTNELEFVHGLVTELLKNATTDGVRPGMLFGAGAILPHSRNAELLSAIFDDESNRSAFLCRSFIFERARGEFHYTDIRYWHGPPKREHQLSAHLHCLYGVPQLRAYPSNSDTLPPPPPVHHPRVWRLAGRDLMRPFACSKIYDLRRYTAKTKWGPFMDDGSMRVDWEQVEAVMIAIGANLASIALSRVPKFATFSSIPFAGTWPHSWKPTLLARARAPDPLEHLDPYGITGVWLRAICFIDYAALWAYNFTASAQPPAHVPRPAFEVGEVTRIVLMRLYVTKVEPPGPEDGQALPVVHFKGVSKSLYSGSGENIDSDVKGSVRLTPEGEVRWTCFTLFSGVERWRSEGIQVGGVESAKGVIGHWFDKDFDPRGPAGPTAFWKVSNKNKSSRIGDVDDDLPADAPAFGSGESDDEDGADAEDGEEEGDGEDQDDGIL